MIVLRRVQSSCCAGFVHLYSGQEAVSTGVIRQLRKSDYICSTYRDHVHALSKGVVGFSCTVPSSCFLAPLCTGARHAVVCCPHPTAGSGLGRSECCAAQRCHFSLPCAAAGARHHGRAVRQEDGHLPGAGRLHAHVFLRVGPGALGSPHVPQIPGRTHACSAKPSAGLPADAWCATAGPPLACSWAGLLSLGRASQSA